MITNWKNYLQVGLGIGFISLSKSYFSVKEIAGFKEANSQSGKKYWNFLFRGHYIFKKGHNFYNNEYKIL